MRKSFRSYVLALSLFFMTMGSCVAVFAQTPSTLGKEFWVAFMQNEKKPELSLAISAENACNLLTIENPGGVGVLGSNMAVPAGLNPINGLGYEAYVTSSEVVENKVLRLEFDADVALFASNYVEKVFDNAAILPTTALLSEYVIQTYPNSSGKQEYAPEFLIVATEDNTVVEITPTWKTEKGKPAGQMFTVTLNRGQCYQVKAESNKLGSDLSGSVVRARNGKRIAVFNGNQSESIPYGGGSDGDHLYEQAMPVAYWGTNFVLTRTMRGQDKIRVTAISDGTTLMLDGVDMGVTLNMGETYEFAIPTGSDNQEAFFLETSCPCGVYQYLVSSHAYAGTGTTDKVGGPSMVWVSPIEQMIQKVNFATYETGVTHDHYVNIVSRTSNAPTVVLTGSTSGVQPLQFWPIMSMPEYSYARVKIPNDSYTIESREGVVAYAYGLGENEGYAYSAGSSVKVQNGITINGVPFSAAVGESQIKVCYGDTVHCVSEILGVDKISWDMADGVTYEDSLLLNYLYDAPGVYDIEVVFSTFVNYCSTIFNSSASGLTDTINVRVVVGSPDTISYKADVCKTDLPYIFNGKEYNETQLDTLYYACDSVVIVGVQVWDSVVTHVTGTYKDEYMHMNGQVYYENVELTEVFERMNGCDSTVYYHITVLQCLDMSVGALPEQICPDEKEILVPYDKYKGTIQRATITFDQAALAQGFQNGELTVTDTHFVIPIPAGAVEPDHYTAKITVEDATPDCGNKEFDIAFTLYYPASVFVQKWDDVLVVLNKEYNGGYDFVGFQWYKNGQPIAGQTSSRYYQQGVTLEEGAEYAVLLTRASDGKAVMTCPYTPVHSGASQIAVNPSRVAPKGELKVTAETEVTAVFYDVMGNRYEVDNTQNNSVLRAPHNKGMYLLEVTPREGERQYFRIMVE